MAVEPKLPVSAEQPTICSVCAWRLECRKKYSYEQGGVVKCPDFTRDAALTKEDCRTQ